MRRSFTLLAIQQRADHLFDQHGSGVDAIKVTAAVVIMIVRTQIVPAAQVVRNRPIAVEPAVAASPPLTAIELLHLARRHAALLGEAGRAAAHAIAAAMLGVAVGVPMTVAMAVAVPIARLGGGRAGECQCRSAGKDDAVFHVGFLEDG